MYSLEVGNRPVAYILEAEEDIRTGAVAHYQIPQSTIKNKLKGDFNRKPGCPIVYLLEEENITVMHVKNRQNLVSP
jgi:hypothetical protein